MSTQNNAQNAVSTVVKDAQQFGQSIRAPSMQAQIKAALPAGVSLDRFTATTQTAINHNPDLLKADRQSLYNAIVKCAADGLLPDGNDAVLNIYNTNTGTRDKPQWTKKVQYQRMVGGLLKQFTGAGILAYAVSVYANDKFEFWNDNDGQHVKHVPVTFGDRGQMVGVFAAAKLPNGLSIVEPLNLDDIEKVRASSKSADGDNAPWKVWYDRMAQKSALHRLRKRVAIVDEKAAASLGKIDDEFDQDTGEIPEPTDVTPTPQGQRSNRPKALQNVVENGGGDQGGDGGAPGPDDVV